MKLAEASAAKTAAAAKRAALTSRADRSDATAELELADVEEVAAHDRYRTAVTAVTRAEERRPR
jgi:hypothetical protein